MTVAPNQPADVVIVEPDTFTRAMLCQTLEGTHRFRCRHFTAFDEAVAHLTIHPDQPPAACLLNLSSTGRVRWLDVVRQIKATTPRTAIVITTTQHDSATLLQCLKSGAVDYLFLPFDAERLPAFVAAAIHRQDGITERHGDIDAVNPFDGWVELTAASELEYLARVQRFIEALLLTRLPEGVREDLRLTIEEVGRNAIEWGNRFDRSKQFSISYCLFEDRIVLKFEDEGSGFKPKAIPDPTHDPIQHIKKRKAEGKRPGGFGVFLVQKLMDEVIYSERGNVVVMTKYFAEKPPSRDSDLLQDI